MGPLLQAKRIGSCSLSQLRWAVIMAGKGEQQLEMWEALGWNRSGHRCDSEVLLTFLLIISWEQDLLCCCVCRQCLEVQQGAGCANSHHGCGAWLCTWQSLKWLAFLPGPAMYVRPKMCDLCPCLYHLDLPYETYTVSCLWSLLFKDCMSYVLFWCSGRMSLGVRAEDITGVRVTKGRYCIFLKSVLSWQEFLLRQQ